MYVRIIKVLNMIHYVILPGTYSHLLVFLRSSIYVRPRCIHNMAGIWIRALKTGVPGVISALTEIMSAWEGYTYACFLLVQKTIIHCPRRRSRQTLYFRAATRFLLANDISFVREATVVVRFDYFSRLLAIAAANSAMVSKASSTFRLRELSKVYMPPANNSWFSWQVQCL